MADYTPQILVRNGVERVANSISQQVSLEYDGYVLKGKEATPRNTTAAQRDGGAPRPVTAEAKAAAAEAKPAEPAPAPTAPQAAPTAGTNGTK
jgi:hypothetical protein